MHKHYFHPIGFIKTPFTKKEEMPIQPNGAKDVKGYIEILPEYLQGLQDLEGFSHIILIYQFHKSDGFKLKVKPFMDNCERGLFSTRAPMRPNPIGISVVKLINIEKNIVHIENVDILHDTPLLDIKPYVPDIDSPQVTKLGWLKNKSHKMGSARSDNRFSDL